MNTSSILAKEKIISLSELQKNPIRALDASIVRIVKNGKEIGVFFSKEEFEDFLEERLPYKIEFKENMKNAQANAKKTKLKKLSSLKIK